jgi:hypothetical protein
VNIWVSVYGHPYGHIFCSEHIGQMLTSDFFAGAENMAVRTLCVKEPRTPPGTFGQCHIVQCRRLAKGIMPYAASKSRMSFFSTPRGSSLKVSFQQICKSPDCFNCQMYRPPACPIGIPRPKRMYSARRTFSVRPAVVPAFPMLRTSAPSTHLHCNMLLGTVGLLPLKYLPVLSSRNSGAVAVDGRKTR